MRLSASNLLVIIGCLSALRFMVVSSFGCMLGFWPMIDGDVSAPISMSSISTELISLGGRASTGIGSGGSGLSAVHDPHV